jgi:hypothetical protein
MLVYLKLGDVKGWSKGRDHVGWIVLQSASISFGRGVSSYTRDKSADISCTRTLDGLGATLIKMSGSGGLW